MANSRSVVNDRCETRLVFALDAAIANSSVVLDPSGSFNSLLHVFLPPQLVVENRPQDLGSRGRFDGVTVHDELALILFFPLPGDVNGFSLFCGETESGLLGLPAKGDRTSTKHRNSGRRVPVAWGSIAPWEEVMSP
jgi:hypothetical protein